MKRRSATLASTAFACLMLAPSPQAETVISTFNDFNLDGLFAWSDATVVSSPAAYSITDTGYGSGYEDINPNIDATGETTIQLTITLSAAGAGPNDPVSGPIVSLVDADGSFHNFAWYGQTVGRHVLTASLSAPTYVSGAGSAPGLDLAALDFFHLQDDPGSFHGQYTIVFEDLRLTGVPGPAIQSYGFDFAAGECTLAWSSRPGCRYSVLHTSALGTAFAPLLVDFESQGATTTAIVSVSAGQGGFIQVLEQ